MDKQNMARQQIFAVLLNNCLMSLQAASYKSEEFELFFPLAFPIFRILCFFLAHKWKKKKFRFWLSCANLPWTIPCDFISHQIIVIFGMYSRWCLLPCRLLTFHILRIVWQNESVWFVWKLRWSVSVYKLSYISWKRDEEQRINNCF